MTTSDTIREDVSNGSSDEAFEAEYLRQYESAGTDNDEGDDAEVDVNDDDQEVEDDLDTDVEADDADEGDEADDDKPAAKTKVINDDDVVEHPVNGVVQKFTVAALKRLAGQEVAITQRGQAASSKLELADRSLALAIKQAEARFAPYDGADMFKLSRDLDAETFDAFRSAGEAALRDLNALRAEQTEVKKQVTDEQMAEFAAKQQETWKTMASEFPKVSGGKEWSMDQYSTILKFATEAGAPEVGQSLNSAVLLMVRDAMAYRASKAAAAEKIKKAAPAPARTIQSRKSAAETARPNAAMKRLRATGSDDDFAAAYIESLERHRS